MMMTDHPRWQDGPVDFKVLICRLLLAHLVASWAANDAAKDRRENAIEREPAEKDPARGLHAFTGAAGSGIQ